MNKRILWGVRATLVATFVISFSALPESLHAFGPRRKPTPPPAPGAETQAFPTRLISMGKFLETTFTLPDGKTQVDMSVHLPELFVTTLSQTTNRLRLRSSKPIQDPNGDRFVITGGITAFEANAYEGGIRIGYRAGAGDIGTGTLAGVSGGVRFAVSQLDMDFHVVDTVRREVVAVGHGSAVGVGGKIDVTLDFGTIQTPADFVFKSPMAAVFRSALTKAVTQMANDPNTNFFMDWSSQVVGLGADVRALRLGVGARDAVALGNLFSVYDNSGLRIGEVKVQNIDFESSLATFKDDLEGRLYNSVRIGDTVKIRFLQLPGDAQPGAIRQ